ncbi:hypothetical protein BDP27DRAFT_1419768 [Rhodocollybia butyracea]|uniref:Uncharacterized protein n=1 Tax=Rhodocollybia butyracea TaxID=206335 RepID=A0A9P5PYE5_9AGAR|nr:hypothetical protein BDP27DRAFT_1419768 [Rhodocollybia butyracea]
MATHNNGRLVALPSLSNGLNTLPKATSMSNLPVHNNMFVTSQHMQQSQAKLQQALHNNHSQKMSLPYGVPPSPSHPDAATLMMRKSHKTK